MLTKDEIKSRYRALGAPIDRHGVFVDAGAVGAINDNYFPALLHYNLIAGMSNAEALTKLRTDFRMSEFAAKYVLDQTLIFIKETLDIDLDQIRKERSTTAGMCCSLLEEIISTLKQTLRTKREMPLIYNEKVFQVHDESRERIKTYLLTETCPDRWILADNSYIPFTLTDLLGLQKAITVRDAAEFSTITEQKRLVREMCEQRDYAGLFDFAEKLKSN